MHCIIIIIIIIIIITGQLSGPVGRKYKHIFFQRICSVECMLKCIMFSIYGIKYI